MRKVVGGVTVAVVVWFGVVVIAGVAAAWDVSANATPACVDGAVSISISFTNAEPAEQAIVVSASDSQTHEAATWSNGESEVTVPGGETVTGTITPHEARVSAGSARIVERWAHTDDAHDEFVVGYRPLDCTTPAVLPAMSATTQGTGGCDTATGGEFVNWSVTNTGEIGIRPIGSDFPGGFPDTLIEPGQTIPIPTVHTPGTYQVASYHVTVRSSDDRFLTVTGNLTPPLAGDCIVTRPVNQDSVPPPTTDTTPVPVSSVGPPAAPTATPATLPLTGAGTTWLTILGAIALGLGLLTVLTASNGNVRRRRLGFLARGPRPGTSPLGGRRNTTGMNR